MRTSGALNSKSMRFLARGGSEFRAGSARRTSLAFAVFLLLFALFGKTNRLADAIAEIVELGATVFAAATHNHLGNEWRMNREDTLDAFVVHDAADCKCFVN